MKLARLVYRNNNPWRYRDGTIVQYEPIINGVFRVYFPGVRGYASISGWVFGRYFKDLDDEISYGGSYRGYMGAD